MYETGKPAKVQRSLVNSDDFIIGFGNAEIAKILAIRLTDTIQYTNRGNKKVSRAVGIARNRRPQGR
jgi:hypothetical protein